VRRATCLLALALLAGFTVACGGAVPETEPAAAPADAGQPPPDTSGFTETGGSEPATTSTEPKPAPGPELKPPPIVLETEAGRQEAVQGSYCITHLSEGGLGEGLCVDTLRPHPAELSVVAPGDEITISLPGATIVTEPPGCSGPCDSTVSLRPLGCGEEQEATRVLDEDGLTWTVDLEPGAYQLDVFVQHFDDGKGMTGDTSGSLGLLVDADRDPAIIPVDESLAVCPYPDQP
jgi:hypothetical protein